MSLEDIEIKETEQVETTHYSIDTVHYEGTEVPEDLRVDHVTYRRDYLT